jgi:hypothetical protein
MGKSKKRKKKNFPDAEIELMITEVEAKPAIFFGVLSNGLTNKGNKYCLVAG